MIHINNQIKNKGRSFRVPTGVLAAFCCSVFIVGCDNGTSSGAAPKGQGGPGGLPGNQSVEVGVVTVTNQPLSMTVELPGRVNAVRDAQVRARVTGILQKRFFEEGADVKEGDLLFQIDPAPLQASYDSAKAALAKAEAALVQAKTKAERYRSLVKINAVSQQDEVDARTSSQQCEADVMAAKAALETASLNLGYTKVTAPISGHIGKALVTEGALVSGTELTELAVIRQMNPIYVDFTQSTSEVLALKRSFGTGQIQNTKSNAANVTLELEDGTTYANKGHLMFSDISVNETTSSLTVRAEFPNPEKLLLPGMFVHGCLEEAVNQKAMLVPQRGISRNLNGEAVAMVVTAENQVESRVVQIGSAYGKDQWIVTSGLNSGERIIVEGSQKVNSGSKVIPIPWQNGTTNTGR